jgi:hypothetical protein
MNISLLALPLPSLRTRPRRHLDEISVGVTLSNAILVIADAAVLEIAFSRQSAFPPYNHRLTLDHCSVAYIPRFQLNPFGSVAI